MQEPEINDETASVADIANLLSEMDDDVNDDGLSSDGAAVAELDLDLDALKQSFSRLKAEDAEANANKWKSAFGDKAEVTDVVSGSTDGDDESSDDCFEVVGTF